MWKVLLKRIRKPYGYFLRILFLFKNTQEYRNVMFINK